MNAPQSWSQRHQKDFADFHEGMKALFTVDLSGSGGPEKWLETVRAVRAKVTEFQLFIPNAEHYLKLADTAEKVLVGAIALANLATDTGE